MKNLALIAAVGYNNELGLDNRLLWHIPEDLTFYKKMTMGKNIIMGRNTFESMPVNALKGRNPIVLSSKDIDRYADVICYNNIENLLRMIENSSDDFMVVGGAKVYKEFLPYVDVMYLTELYKEFIADAYFPYVDFRQWDSIKIADLLMMDMILHIKYMNKQYKKCFGGIMKGKLIVIEGSCDGVGKSTQYKLLIDRLINEKEYDITSHHFPSYGTYQGRPVEEYLKGNFGNHSELSPYFVNSLYAQDRAITWITGLKQEYDKGNIIVLDRYTTSSFISILLFVFIFDVFFN